MMRDFRNAAYAFVRRDFRVAMSYKLNFVFGLTAGFFIVMTFYFVSRLVDSEASSRMLARFHTDYFSFVLVGLAAAGLMQTGLTGFSEHLRAGMMEGSLEMTFSCPVRPDWVLVLPCVWAFFFETLKMIVMVAIGIFVFGADLSRANPASFVCMLLATITAYSVFGMLFASIIMVYKRGDVINMAFNMASSLIAGAYFPVELLPSWLAPVARVLPMTYSYEGLRRSLLAGEGVPGVWPQLAVLLGFSAIGLPLAFAVANLAVVKAKRDGSLGVF
jgi:ABC-2 type transport system permease protein